ncbi:MAG: thioredoxin family protein [Bacteroidota bacterium]|nr:thioredoxin family protein [Bacteroidota bacterium]
MLKEIKSHNSLLSEISNTEKLYLLIFKNGSEQSDCAFENIKKIDETISDHTIYYVDVNEVKDIHKKYNITSAPTLIEFKKGTLSRIIKGCHEPAFYKNVMDNNIVKSTASKEKPKRVIIYSTPTCHHCTTLKNHLRSHRINFQDIDISKDQQKAQNLVKKTGQQGVPQISINGRYIVGFDKTRINNLLEIK